MNDFFIKLEGYNLIRAALNLKYRRDFINYDIINTLMLNTNGQYFSAFSQNRTVEFRSHFFNVSPGF